jgi:quinoprotein glucose dehydrogenase
LPQRIAIWSLGVSLVAVGAILATAGGWLVALGGSAYYALAGIGCFLSGSLLIIRKSLGLSLYLAVFLGTVIWALAEVGYSFWELLPRVAGPLAFAILCSVPWIVGGTRDKAPRSLKIGGPLVSSAGVLVLLGTFIASGPDFSDHDVGNTATPSSLVPGQPDDWASFGRTLAGTRYSPDTQITPENVAGLKVAWTYRTGDDRAARPNTSGKMTFEATPLKVGNTLYLCTPHDLVIAIDADTGKERWRFDPKVGDSALLNCRGVSYHQATSPTVAECASEILIGTVDDRLIALDASNGQRCAGFGENGEVSLKVGLGPDPQNLTFVTSPPVIVGNVAAVGALVADNISTDEPSGVVRGFDVATGKLLWAWDSGRPDDAGPLNPGETYKRSSANAWGVFSADPALGLIYVPTGGPTPDYVGTNRSALDQRYANSVVALDADTGKIRWHFQTSHHDLWDYDVPAQPVLFDFLTNVAKTPAVAVPTKRGEIFILDRRSGQPLVPVAEKPAPRGSIPGEDYAPTQPYSSVSLAPPPLRERDMWGATPIDQLYCRIRFRSADYAGNFTPPSVHGAISYPGNFGVLNWGSVAIDEGRQLLIANTSILPLYIKLIPRAEADPILNNGGGKVHFETGLAPQWGTPYAVRILPLISPLGIPCNAPPWGGLVAIDLRTTNVLWRRPFGTTEEQAPLGMPVPGVFNIGGATVTKSGLVFIAATLDSWIRAFDIASGKEMWRAKLPAGGQAGAMTYTSASTGKQYVVITAGGHELVGTKTGDYVVAFALPDTPR